MIITIGSTKGGVGKSTIACNLAVMAAKENKKVLLVDADPQFSSMSFQAIRSNVEAQDIESRSFTTPTLHEELKELSGFDLIVIDSGGRDSDMFRSSILAADILIIPVLTSVWDIWATSDTLEIVQKAKVFNEKLIARFLINKASPNTIMFREAMEALEEIKEIPVLESLLGSRTSFSNGLMKGLAVIEHDPRSKAADEIIKFWQEIKQLGDIK